VESGARSGRGAGRQEGEARDRSAARRRLSETTACAGRKEKGLLDPRRPFCVRVAGARYGVLTVAEPAGLAGVAGVAGLAGVAGVAGVAGLAGVAGVAAAGLSVFGAAFATFVNLSVMRSLSPMAVYLSLSCSPLRSEGGS